MATSNVVIAGATYPDVPAVTLNKSGGGTTRFTDVSDSTAVAADVAQGKYFYTAQGVRTEGTASGGGGATPPETPENAVIFYSLKPFSLYTYTRAKNWNGTLQYSTDNSSWSTWDGKITLTAAQSDGWYKLYLRGSGNTYLSGSSNTSRWVFAGAGTATCAGNLNKLLNYNGTVTLGYNAFAFLFYNWGNVDFKVTLPSTSLATYCYQYMFYNCASLTTAPALPAETLANYCYSRMFQGCTSLITAPTLPATTLANYCYQYMFYECGALTAAPALPATTLTNYCYSNMFNGCGLLTTAPTLPATTLATYCYASMFNGCGLLTTVPALPATTLATYCYQYMFSGCSNIKLSTTQTGAYQTAYRIPTSGTGTTATSALGSMFSNTGGSFTGTPTINTTYYTSNTVIS